MLQPPEFNHVANPLYVSRDPILWMLWSTFCSRITKLNTTCLKLKRHLEKHSSVEEVLHPSNCSNFNSLMRPQAGYGCLLSFKLVGGLEKAQKFYTQMMIIKKLPLKCKNIELLNLQI